MDIVEKTLGELAERIRALERAIETEIAAQRASFHYTVERHRVRFEQAFAVAHRAYRVGFWRQLWQSDLATLLTAPIIYAMVVPFALLDLFLAVYQRTCFRAYGIPRVSRAEYIAFDRQHLAYLNPLEKLNCLYCAYANGMIAYAREIAARTEEYWCPIKHARAVRARHMRYLGFVAYGDASAFRARQDELRRHARETMEPLEPPRNPGPPPSN